MSFKDIDLKKYSKYLNTQKKLGKISGIAEAVTSNDLKKYEYLTDSFVTKPTEQFITHEKLKQSPLTHILEEGNKLNRLQSEQLEDLNEGIDKLITLEKEKYDDPFDDDITLDYESPPSYDEQVKVEVEDDVKKIIRDNNIDTNDPDKLFLLIQKLNGKVSGFGSSKSSKSKNKVQYYKHVRQEYMNKRDDLIRSTPLKTPTTSRKTDKVKRKLEGKGMTKKMIGKFQFDIPKLRKHNMLSLSYPNNRKINGFPNIIVSNNVKKVLMNDKINRKYQLTPTEKSYLNDLYMKSDSNLSKSKNKLLGGCTPVYFMNKDQMIDRMGVIIGELSAGNNNENLINELQNIAYNLYKNKHINKAEYTEIINLI